MYGYKIVNLPKLLISSLTDRLLREKFHCKSKVRCPNRIIAVKYTRDEYYTTGKIPYTIERG